MEVAIGATNNRIEEGIKYLGVIIDDRMNVKNIVKFISKNVFVTGDKYWRTRPIEDENIVTVICLNDALCSNLCEGRQGGNCLQCVYCVSGIMQYSMKRHRYAKEQCC